MILIHELLARIRWDPGSGRGRWEIAYLDHARGELVRLPVNDFSALPGEPFMVEVIEDEGGARSIPCHRVRQRRHDGRRVWSRP